MHSSDTHRDTVVVDEDGGDLHPPEQQVDRRVHQVHLELLVVFVFRVELGEWLQRLRQRGEVDKRVDVDGELTYKMERPTCTNQFGTG